MTHGRAKPYHLESLEDRYPTWAVRSVYTGVNSFVSIFLMAVLAYNTDAPFVFPSLGPTAFLLFHTPLAAASSPHNALVGHLTGVLAGWFSLALTGLLSVPPDLEKIDWQRILACAIALGLTCGLMPIFQAAHPPAVAERPDALVAFGGDGLVHLLIMMIAVCVVVLQGLLINRAAGLPYPTWRARTTP